MPGNKDEDVVFSVCEYYVHVDCVELAVSDCKEAAAYVPNLDRVSGTSEA